MTKLNGFWSDSIHNNKLDHTILFEGNATVSALSEFGNFVITLIYC